MPSSQFQQSFIVSLMVLAAGPVRPRTKYKLHKRLRAERVISLPFVPYPGVYLTMQQPGKRNPTITLYLRIRTGE